VKQVKRKTITLLAYGLPILLVAAIMAFNIFRPIQVLPRIGLGPGFGLTNLEGKKITNETMRGKITLYSFTYTNCDAACPGLMDKMQEVRDRSAELELGDVDFELVTITIDPERDTPERLAEYAATYGVTPNDDPGSTPWHFVTGADPELVKIMVSSGFELFHEKTSDSSDDYQFKFTPMAILIDGWGLIRAEYRQYEATERLSFSEGTTDIDPDIILRDVGLVAQEANNSRGMAKSAYEAAHLFACYPP
jgi:protein SCO1/2